MSDQSHYFGQFNYVGVGVTRGLHSSTAAIYSGSATYRKVASNNDSSVVINYGTESYDLDMSDMFIDIGVGIGSVGIRSDTQIIINTPSTENPNVQVGDIVDFDRSSGGLNDQLSRVVGVGTYYFIIEDNIDPNVSSANGNCIVQKLETFPPTGIGATGNYRGAICLNDNNVITNGDFDDFILRCHSAITTGSGTNLSVAFFQFTNNGAFYGPPVTSDKDQREDGANNGKGYIFGKDNVEGNDADADGGIGQSNNYYKRLSNTFYRYSIPTVSMEYINGGQAGIGNNHPSGQNGRYTFGQGMGNNRIYINLVDANGNNNQNFFFNTIGRGSDFSGYPDPTLWNFKVTSLETKSNVDIYSTERSYVWCRIISDDRNGDTYTPSGGTTRLFYSFEVIACNTNLSSGGQPGNSSGFGGTAGGTKKSIIEWFKSDDTSTGNSLRFFGSIDGSNNAGIAIAAQKVQNNTWTHIVKKFERSDLTYISGDPVIYRGNIDRDILPNLDYRVWAFSRKPAPTYTVTSRPYLKIINHPDSNTPDE